MRQFFTLKVLRRVFFSALAVVSAYTMMIFFPSFLYAYEYKNGNVKIYSDQKLPSNIDGLTLSILERIRKSAYFNAQDEYKVFISNETWRWRLVANLRPHAGGFNIELRPNHSFIRPSVIAENRILPPRGSLADAEDRDLAYFISHEITHGMMVNAIGLSTSLFKTQTWIKEAYADMIGKKSFDYAGNLAQLKADEKRLQISSGLYVRYHLALVYLLEKKGMSFPEIIKNNPKLEEVTQEMLALK